MITITEVLNDEFNVPGIVVTVLSLPDNIFVHWKLDFVD